jgi:hypothetical protein
MTPRNSVLLAVTLVCAASVAAHAQPAYPPYSPYPYNQLAAVPPAWNYDPYTSGLGPCPQRRASDPPCRETMQPTYGQPSYWPQPRW